MAFSTSSANAARNPILFVHGWSGAAWNWDIMKSRFQSNGYASNQLYAYSYNSLQSNVTTAYWVRDRVNAIRAATGASKVDLISHSMGGLSTRYYIRNLGGANYVDDYISIGGPNHGTNASYLCDLLIVSCNEMNYNSAFLNGINYPDETPGSVYYRTIRSWCDEIINPDSSTSLSGATNTLTWGCIGHLSLLGSSEVFNYTYNAAQ